MYNIKVTPLEFEILEYALIQYRNNGCMSCSLEFLQSLEESIKDQRSQQREAVEAFETAVKAGVLSLDEKAPNRVGYYMYMGKDSNGKAQFKHYISRAYLKY